MNTHVSATDFPVVWPEPADAGLTWFRDAMHFPAPLTPLTSSFLRECLEPGVAAACATLVSPLRTLRHSSFNGWVYNSPVLAVAPEDIEERLKQHLPVMGDHMDNLRRRWETEYLPAVRRLTDEIDSLEFGGEADAALDAFAQLIEIDVDIWRIHFLIVFPKLAAGERFSGIYVQATGSTDEMEPYRCMQGEPNKSLEADRALWDLAREAQAAPAVAAVLAAGSPADALDALDHSPEGRAWRERFATFLDEYGHRAQAMDLSAPTWVEEPSFAVENLRRYLAVDAADPEGQRERLRAEAEALVRGARERITDPGLLGAFDHAYEVALAAWPLEEDHAFYIDQRSLAGATRRAFLRIATTLAGRGRIADPGDIWYLDFDAVRDGLAGEDVSLARPRGPAASRRRQPARRPAVPGGPAGPRRPGRPRPHQVLRQARPARDRRPGAARIRGLPWACRGHRPGRSIGGRPPPRAARRDPRLPLHDAAVDPGLRIDRGARHRHRRRARSRGDRREGVRHPRGDGNEDRHADHPGRPADHGRRRRRRGVHRLTQPQPA